MLRDSVFYSCTLRVVRFFRFGTEWLVRFAIKERNKIEPLFSGGQ